MGSDFPLLVSAEFLITRGEILPPLPPSPAITVNENKEHFIEGVWSGSKASRGFVQGAVMPLILPA